jgi:drug/metabolite transporter (DMT)-like permease
VNEEPPRARTIFRSVVAVIVAAVAGAAIFLIMVQGSFHKGFTDLDFNHVLGTAVEGTTLKDTQAREALGLVGDRAGPIGLYSVLIGAAVLLAVYGLVARRVHRHWVLQGLGLGVVTFLVIGLAAPIADARQDEFPTGLFGVDAGGFTVVVLGLSALGFGLVAARCFDLIMSTDWWEPAEAEIDEVEAVTGVKEDGSLELPEEGTEESGVRA